MSMYRRCNFQYLEVYRTIEQRKVPKGSGFILLWGACQLLVYTGVPEGRPEFFSRVVDKQEN